MPGVLSHTFFRFECNIRTAAILGVVGAGGIGTELMQHRSLYMYNAITVDVMGILALVLLADWLGAAVRKQVS
ncbi:MAG TPA: phosphonate ABC transporter, permease protein PhnE, partial [Symbiobacteriaceae bacterium]|nr:phosphonate ABC transporter, permease protein PhnE [Symbiobacteriaceae bacterium]